MKPTILMMMLCYKVSIWAFLIMCQLVVIDLIYLLFFLLFYVLLYCLGKQGVWFVAASVRE